MRTLLHGCVHTFTDYHACCIVYFLQDDRRAEALVCARLGDFFIRKADPGRTGRWEGEAKRYFADIVYYQLRALQVHACL